MFELPEIRSILQGFNPWWSGKQISNPYFKRLAFHGCLQLLDTQELKRAILLSGPRRVGKTTILLQLAEEYLQRAVPAESILYLSLDHPFLKIISLPQILKFYHETIHPEKQPAILLLDEIQYTNDWDLELKQLIDHHPEYKIVVTGSTVALHRAKLAETGVGRWMTVPVPTLNFYEFAKILGEKDDADFSIPKPNELIKYSENDLFAIKQKLRHLMPLFQRYLLMGGFPETAIQKDVMLSQRILREDVVERVLKRDMTAVFGIRRVAELEKLFIYLCMHSGEIFSARSCASALEQNSMTIINHIKFLEQSNLIYRVEQEKLTGKSVLNGKPKIYIVDSALVNAMLLRGEEILNDSKSMGSIVETTVLRHLYAYYYRDTPRIGYWRDSSTNEEVDIIIRSPAYVIPVEIKYRNQAGIPEKCGLRKFCSAEKITYGVWVTQQEDDFDIRTLSESETKVLRIPAHIFCYLLGFSERKLWGKK
ncbi:MAG: ATP-binding protein [Elusimicrobiota bacterium]